MPWNRGYGTAHSVVAHLLQQPDFAFLRFGVTTGTQNAVVVVDTGTEQDDPLAVEQKSVIAPGKGPHAECRLGASHRQNMARQR